MTAPASMRPQRGAGAPGLDRDAKAVFGERPQRRLQPLDLLRVADAPGARRRVGGARAQLDQLAPRIAQVAGSFYDPRIVGRDRRDDARLGGEIEHPQQAGVRPRAPPHHLHCRRLCGADRRRLAHADQGFAHARALQAQVGQRLRQRLQQPVTAAPCGGLRRGGQLGIVDRVGEPAARCRRRQIDRHRQRNPYLLG